MHGESLWLQSRSHRTDILQTKFILTTLSTQQAVTTERPKQHPAYAVKQRYSGRPVEDTTQ
jgi:hypothetical protein